MPPGAGVRGECDGRRHRWTGSLHRCPQGQQQQRLGPSAGGVQGVQSSAPRPAPRAGMYAAAGPLAIELRIPYTAVPGHKQSTGSKPVTRRCRGYPGYLVHSFRQ